MTEILRPRANTSPIHGKSEMKNLLQMDGLNGMDYVQHLCNRESIQFGSLAEAYEMVLDSASSTTCCNSSLSTESEESADPGSIKPLPVRDILLPGATLASSEVIPKAQRYVQPDLPMVIYCFASR